MDEIFFFDTYALFEIVKGNPNYQKYTGDVGIITTKLNLMELYYGMLINFSTSDAEQFYKRYSEFCIEISDELIKAAVKFRVQNRKRNLSYVDCIGYTLANEAKVKFLTGDKSFENLPVQCKS